jgi:Protein of unknown function (DUF4232)
MALRSSWAKRLLTIAIVTTLFGLFVERGVASGTKILACTAKQLRTVAYGTGVATGTEYFAVAITNRSKTRCRVGSQITLLRKEGRTTTKLAAGIRTAFPPSSKLVTVLRGGQRATATITTIWAAEEAGNPDCPDGQPHPLDRVSAIKLDTGTMSVVDVAFDLERCRRSIAPLTDDYFLTQCEQAQFPCLPISSLTHRAKIG